MSAAGESKMASGDVGAGARAGQRRVAVGVLLAAGAVIAAVSQMEFAPERGSGRGVGAQTSSINRTPAMEAAPMARGIDPNTATWAELAQLPGIGEAFAKAIVDYRDERRRPGATGVVFRTPADLEPVPGVGGKMIERMAPWLRFEAAGK